MAMRWTVFQAIAWADVAAGAANTTSRSTGTGERRPHSSATMPPSDPPVASARRSTPQMLEQGNVGVGEVGGGELGERHRRARPPIPAGRSSRNSCPGGWRVTMAWRDVSSGLPGPTSGPHHCSTSALPGQGVKDQDPAVLTRGRHIAEDAIAEPEAREGTPVARERAAPSGRSPVPAVPGTSAVTCAPMQFCRAVHSSGRIAGVRGERYRRMNGPRQAPPVRRRNEKGQRVRSVDAPEQR